MGSKSTINFVIVLIVFCISLVFSFTSSSRFQNAMAIALLTSVSWIVGLHHKEEFLQFRVFYMLVYTFIGSLGLVLVMFCHQYKIDLFLLLIMWALSMAILWIPGVIRLLIYHVGKCRGKNTGWLMEAMSLICTYIPSHIRDIHIALRYPLEKVSTFRSLKSLVCCEWVIRVLYTNITSMHLLATATVTRQFRVTSYHPTISLTTFERLYYVFVIGVLVWLILA